MNDEKTRINDMRLKIAILATLLLAVISGSHAQNRFDACLFAGLNMGQLDGDDAGRYNHPGLRAGIGTSWDIGGGWRPVVELAYTQKGSYISEYNRRISADYVEVAMMMSYNMLDERLRLAAGVAPGVLVRAKVTNSGELDQPSTDNFCGVDWLPLTFTARYRFGVHLALEGRWQNSMLNVTKENGSGTYRIFRSNKGTFHRLVTFGLSYTF